MNVIFYRVFFLGFHFFLLRFSLLLQKKKKNKRENMNLSTMDGNSLIRVPHSSSKSINNKNSDLR